jgi:hypothetical protein
VFDQFKGRRVQLRQIVEKQRERVLRPGERADKPLEDHLEAILDRGLASRRKRLGERKG